MYSHIGKSLTMMQDPNAGQTFSTACALAHLDSMLPIETQDTDGQKINIIEVQTQLLRLLRARCSVFRVRYLETDVMRRKMCLQ